MIELKREDWERVKKQAELSLKEASMMHEVNQIMLDCAEKALKKFPKEDRKPLGV